MASETHDDPAVATGSGAVRGPALVSLQRDECLRLDLSLTREWLETDGLGGYASSSVPMGATRRYHGLLVAPIPGSAKRHVLLSRLEETVVGPELFGQERSFPLSLARYAGCFAPKGHLGLESFELVPWPRWHYRLGLAAITREVLMPRGRHAVLVRYHNQGERAGLKLRLRPLLPFREADALTFENMSFDANGRRQGGALEFRPYRALPALSISVLDGDGQPARYEADPVWYRGIEYREDLARGYDGYEDQGSPGWFEIDLPIGGEVLVAASLEGAVGDPQALWRAETARRSEERAALGDPAQPLNLAGRLSLAAEHYIYRDARARLGVLAGFPWFGEWGRDTYIALPGLLLARGQVEAAGDALCGALRFLQNGLLPNVFGTGLHDSAYNSADAALWFTRAVRLYERAGGDRTRLDEELYPAMFEIARAYLDGRCSLVRVDQAGLLVVGGPNENATWMDARTPEGPVTPRDGCPVEIEGLWYQLLALLEQHSRKKGDADGERDWAVRRRLAGKSFLRRLWLDDERYLADLWHSDNGADRSLRPNQVIAASLEFSPLSQAKRADVLHWAEIELLTPFGLRTLAPNDPRFEGRYGGSQTQRDGAYHQGTVWPWLIGPYVEAFVRVHGARRRRLRGLRDALERFHENLDRQGLNQLSEVFDGDPPHRPGGTIAQAWSVGEVLRALRLLEEALA